MPKSQVVVIGDACVDMVIRLPDRKSNTPDLRNSVPQLQGGGTAANTAAALARLGVDVTMAGAVGDDGYGRWIRDDLVREGVDVKGLYFVHDAFTPMVMALIELNGERSLVVWPPEGGAHQHLQTDAVNPTLISSASWLHTTGICLREPPVSDTVLYSMELARKADVTVSLDLNLRLESWDLSDAARRTFERAIELSDVVFGNGEEEIIPLAGTDSVEDGAQQLSDNRRIIIARRGNKGVFVAAPNETFHVSPFKTQIVDTLGAGDAFNGGFIAACMAKAGTMEAARWGNAAAALKIGQAGARGLPYLKDVKQMLGQAAL